MLKELSALMIALKFQQIKLLLFKVLLQNNLFRSLLRQTLLLSNFTKKEFFQENAERNLIMELF
jgi:hypothetical protein